MVRALVLLILLCVSTQARADPSDFAYDQRLGGQLPLDAMLQDETGGRLSLRQAIGQRPAILALGYFRCPDLCGLVRADLMTALSELDAGRAYSLIVLSIDPAETAADARIARATDVARFARPGVMTGWHYLTGSAADIAAVGDAVGFHFQPDAKGTRFLHPAGIVFLTPSGTVSGYLLGLGYQPGDVSLGLARAENGVTARALPILLLCFHYDETTGRYSFAIERVLQLGGGITVLVIGTTVVLALRRERRRR